MIGVFYSKELLPKVLDGTKTVTRRLIKTSIDPDFLFVWEDGNVYQMGSGLLIAKPRWPLHSIQYIREPFRYRNGDGYQYDFVIEFKDGFKNSYWDNAGEMNYPIDETWRSPYWMKEVQARWFQQIVDVRPEHGIVLSPEELKKEGGSIALNKLQDYAGFWVWRYEFKLLRQEELK